MPKFNSDRLAKTAAGDPAELCLDVTQGNGTSPVPFAGGGNSPNPKPGMRDGLVSVIQLATPGLVDGAGGSAFVDRTKTAKISAGGSLIPGADVGDTFLQVMWYKFEG